MNELIVFVGPNERITPLEVEASKEGFKYIEVCAFDYEHEYASKKLKQFLKMQDREVLFRFIFPFNFITFNQKMQNLIDTGTEESLAKLQIFEEYVNGWKEFINSVNTPIREVNSLEAVIFQRNKQKQYKKLEKELNNLPFTVYLSEEKDHKIISDMLEEYKGVVFKPISGAESKGIYIITKEQNRYLLKSDIKESRNIKDISNSLEETLKKLHSPGYVVQQKIEFSKVFGDHDFDLRIHTIGGEIVGTAAFFYNPETKTEEIKSIESIAEKNLKLKEALEESNLIGIKATQILGLDVSGVDIMLSGKDYKPYIIEINSFPGWALLEANPELEIARKEVEFYKKILR
ncbi:MAG: hypothetical protein KAS65_12900 [Candidatus Aminicenantes bacterium]|nr:hypothetical protein [Candidatus Aminicenantes bacterium]